MKPLTVPSSGASYYIQDGDIPCTPETEPTLSYVWNFCASVTPASIPSACSKLNKNGVVLQYLEMGDFYDCYVLGRYDPAQDDLYYSLLDSSDPTKGVSMRYPQGDSTKCKTAGVTRSVTLDVQCANTKALVVSAQEPSVCEYHLVMKSYYGCPTVTSRVPQTIFRVFLETCKLYFIFLCVFSFNLLCQDCC